RSCRRSASWSPASRTSSTTRWQPSWEYVQLLLARDIPTDIKRRLETVSASAQTVLRRLETVCAEAERMARIVKNLLTFARKHPPEKRHLGLNGIIEKNTRAQRVNRIEVTTDLAPDLPMT